VLNLISAFCLEVSNSASGISASLSSWSSTGRVLLNKLVYKLDLTSAIISGLTPFPFKCFSIAFKKLFIDSSQVD